MMPNEFKPNLIRNWRLQAVYDGFVIFGEVYNDQKKRFEDGTFIHTSRVRVIDFDSKVVVTRNSIYNLE